MLMALQRTQPTNASPSAFDCVSERARGLLTVLTAMGGASRSGARPPPPKTAVRRAMLLLGGGALLLACAVGRPGGAGVPAEREQSTGAGTAAGCAGTARAFAGASAAPGACGACAWRTV